MSSQARVYKWSTIDRVLNTVITFGGNIVLARLLSPDDFGLLAMVAIFTAVAYNLSSCGLSDGIIKKLRPTENDYSTVFTFNALAGVFFCVLFIAFSHPVARFFNQPALVGIMWAIGICFVFQVMSFIQETRLRKELDMRKMAIVRISASASAVGLGILLAMKGFGYWGLVSCRIFLSVFLFIYYVIATRWIPRLRFYRNSFNEMFGFGVNLMLAYLLGQVSRNLSSFVLGKISPSGSGVYSQAQKLEEVPYGMLDSIVTLSFFAILSNESDRERRRALSLQMLSRITSICITIGLMVTLLAGPGVELLYGKKWLEAIPVIRILVFFGIACELKYFFQAVMKSYGVSRDILWFTVGELIIQLAALALVYHRGIIWIAWTQVLGVTIMLGLYGWRYCRIEQISFWTMVRTAVKELGAPLAAFAVVSAGYWFWNDAVSSLLSCVLTLVSYAIAVIGLWELFPNPDYIHYRNIILARLGRKPVSE